MIQHTTLEAFKVLQPELGTLQNMVYNYLKAFPNRSNYEIARDLHKRINSITPRTLELRNKGLVVNSGYKHDPFTHRRVITWSVCGDDI